MRWMRAIGILVMGGSLLFGAVYANASRHQAPVRSPRFIVLENCGRAGEVNYAVLLDTKTGRQYIQGHCRHGASLTELTR